MQAFYCTIPACGPPATDGQAAGHGRQRFRKHCVMPPLRLFCRNERNTAFTQRMTQAWNVDISIAGMHFAIIFK